MRKGDLAEEMQRARCAEDEREEREGGREAK